MQPLESTTEIQLARHGAGAIDGGPPDYAIRPDTANRCLVIDLPGRWSEPLLRQYLAELRVQTRTMMQAGAYRGALIDVSDYGIQSPHIAAGHAEAMWRAKSMYGVKAAMFAIGGRPKLQMMRIARQTGHRLFDRREDALDWLLA